MHILMAILSNAMPERIEDLRFEARDDGPYSPELEAVLESLESRDLISLPSCSPTDDGRSASAGNIPGQPLRGVVDATRPLVTGMTRDEILLMVYHDHPELRCDREWRRLEVASARLAERMFLKGRATAGRAAELSGLSEGEFLECLYRRGAWWRDPIENHQPGERHRLGYAPTKSATVRWPSPKSPFI